jgi:uncharacterized membrane protein
MNLKTVKAVTGIGSAALVSTAFFVYGNHTTDLWFVLGAILLLSGKELEEFRKLRQAGQEEEFTESELEELLRLKRAENELKADG